LDLAVAFLQLLDSLLLSLSYLAQLGLVHSKDGRFVLLLELQLRGEIVDPLLKRFPIIEPLDHLPLLLHDLPDFHVILQFLLQRVQLATKISAFTLLRRYLSGLQLFTQSLNFLLEFSYSLLFGVFLFLPGLLDDQQCAHDITGIRTDSHLQDLLELLVKVLGQFLPVLHQLFFEGF
jgi:hypothetical protein